MEPEVMTDFILGFWSCGMVFTLALVIFFCRLSGGGFWRVFVVPPLWPILFPLFLKGKI
jgi:hypothetical protein